MLRMSLTLAAGGFFVAMAHGEPNEAVRAASDAFAQGRYQEAASLAETRGHADAYALAARALLAEAMCGEGQPDAALLDRAEWFARGALDQQPTHIEGRLQLAITLSLKARGLSRSQAWRSGYGSEARGLAEAVITDDPGNAYAHGFLAVWHVEVVRRGGSIGAAMMDASLSEALIHYGEASALMPDDPGLHWQMARALVAHNPRRHRDRAEAALAAALAIEPETALDAVMVRRARVLSEAMATQNTEAVKRLAKDML